MNPHHPISPNPNSLRSRFTRLFLKALTRVRKQRKHNSSSSPKDMFQRYYKVKTAADKSLARAVGSRRSWSRALLLKIRNKARRHHTRRVGVVNKSSDQNGVNNEENGTQELRKLVPGGEAMELCSLLEEAAHYIKCLNTQVQVMRKIADFYSPLN